MVKAANDAETGQLVGVKVWIPDSEKAWELGLVKSQESNNKFLVTTKGGTKREVLLDDIRIANTFEDTDNRDGFLSVTDLTTLTHLHEPSLLQALTERFNSNRIYTNTGPILIAVNPFELIDGLYSKDLLLNYYTSGLIQSQTNNIDPAFNLPPHIYKTANSAYRSLLDEEDFLNINEEKQNEEEDLSFSGSQNQSILVSGESGAGKTESTKHIMNYLATVSNQNSKESKQKVAEMVLKSNPILESFGNARTIRNDNSSRFGKFIEMQFNYKGQLVGSRIKTYLLEKVRINSQMKAERNYHIFYQLFKGASDNQRIKLKLDELDLSIKNCSLTCMSGCYSRKDGVKDEKKYVEMLNAMKIMNFNEEEINNILLVISSLMHFSNLSFVEHLVDGNEGSLIDTKDKNAQRINLVSSLLDLQTDFEHFQKSLTQRERVVGNERFQNVLSVTDAKLAKEAVIKTVYSRMFDWVVQRINSSIEYNPSLHSSFDIDMELSFIGVLDIFGFEVFDNNSFEQLCINYANETLQQQFNYFIFKVEQKEYRKEEIIWNNIEFSDNTDILNLIHSKPISVLSLLNEQCLFPNSTHKTLFNKYHEKLKENKYFSCSNKEMVEFKFCIKHYAGKVCYNTLSFIEKNKDILFQEALDLLQTSNNQFINILFPKGEQNEVNSKSIQTITVGTQFKNQLFDLMQVIKQTKPHYIRCLKPNDKNIPRLLNRNRLLDQLRYSGVLEAVKVSRLGYPIRMLHHDFLKRYKYVSKGIEIGSICSDTFNLVSIEDYQIGKTKIFLRKQAYEKIEQRRNIHRKEKMIYLQSMIRMYLSRKIFLLKCKATVIIQSFVRAVFATRFVRKLRFQVNATRIQQTYRMYIKAQYFRRIVFLSITIQRIYRGFKVRRVLLKQRVEKSVIILQNFFRMGTERNEFIKKRKLIVQLQNCWRVRFSKRQLRQLRLEAKQVGNLQHKITELQKRNEELEEELQTERDRVDALESKLDNNEMNEENELLVEQISSHRKENAKLLKLVDELKKENEILKSASSLPTEDIQTIHEFEEPESSKEESIGSDNLETEMDYWTQKMGDSLQETSDTTPDIPISKQPVQQPVTLETAPQVPELELKLQELEEANQKLREELENQAIDELKKNNETAQIIKAKQEVNELKVAMEALAQENKDYKRANYDLQENMSSQIERVCQAENRSIELEESARFAAKELQKIETEKTDLKQILDETLHKVDTMTILAEQTSAVKIALAKRLEDMLAERKKLKTYISVLKKKVGFANDTNRALQSKIDIYKKAKRPVA